LQSSHEVLILVNIVSYPNLHNNSPYLVQQHTVSINFEIQVLTNAQARKGFSYWGVNWFLGSLVLSVQVKCCNMFRGNYYKLDVWGGYIVIVSYKVKFTPPTSMDIPFSSRQEYDHTPNYCIIVSLKTKFVEALNCCMYIQLQNFHILVFFILTYKQVKKRNYVIWL
jgi:hypothetical protein